MQTHGGRRQAKANHLSGSIYFNGIGRQVIYENEVISEDFFGLATPIEKMVVATLRLQESVFFTLPDKFDFG